MKRWNIKITKEAKKDFQQLDNSLKKQVAAGIIKVARGECNKFCVNTK